MSLVARHLEDKGLPTVIIGSARDIVEECAVSRFAFTDFPLGNPCGKPYDQAMQIKVVETALRLLEQAFTGQTTVKVPVGWGDHQWRYTYMQISANKVGVPRSAATPVQRLTNKLTVSTCDV